MQRISYSLNADELLIPYPTLAILLQPIFEVDDNDGW